MGKVTKMTKDMQISLLSHSHGAVFLKEQKTMG